MKFITLFLQNLMDKETATIDDFPGYTFYRDGRASNKYGQFIGYKSKDEEYITTKIRDKDGKFHKKRMHILIMWAFSGEAPNGRDVDHKNGKRDDNRYENLQYLDRKTHNMKTRENNKNINNNYKYRNVQATDKDGNTINFKSLQEAINYFEPGNKSISTMIKRSITNDKFYKNYKWKYLDTESLDNEIWKKPNIENIDPDIEVSNLGRIKRKGGRIQDKFSYENGYMRTSITINGKQKHIQLHTLICSAFHGKQPEWATSVNHIDENKTNNKSDNLEWSNPIKQADSWRVKINLEKDGVITSFNSIKEADEFLNLSRSISSSLLNGKTVIKEYNIIRDTECKKIKARGPVTQNGCAIYQLDENKNIIKEFPTITAAVRELLPYLDNYTYQKKSNNIKIALIRNWKALGYYWQYKNPPENIDELREKIIAKMNERDRIRYHRLKNASVNA